LLTALSTHTRKQHKDIPLFHSYTQIKKKFKKQHIQYIVTFLKEEQSKLENKTGFFALLEKRIYTKESIKNMVREIIELAENFFNLKTGSKSDFLYIYPILF